MFNSLLHHVNRWMKKKSYDYINQSKNIYMKKLTSIYNRNSQKSRIKGQPPKLNKEHLQSTYS